MEIFNYQRLPHVTKAIFTLLRPSDLANCLRVCQQWKRVLTEDLNLDDKRAFERLVDDLWARDWLEEPVKWTRCKQSDLNKPVLSFTDEPEHEQRVMIARRIHNKPISPSSLKSLKG